MFDQIADDMLPAFTDNCGISREPLRVEKRARPLIHH